MKNKESILEITLRVFIATMFIYSGISKLDPIYGFEKQLIDMGVASWSFVPYLSRFIIAFEIFIGCALIDKAWLKKVIIPATGLMLLGFTAHLTWQGFHYGFSNGNCGCFGDKLPMTPFEAIVKNLLTMGALFFLWIRAEQDKRKVPTTIIVAFIGVFFWMFLMYPVKHYFEPKEDVQYESANTIAPTTETSAITIDSTLINDSISVDTISTFTAPSETDTEPAETASNPVVETTDPVTSIATPVTSEKSKFNTFTNFNGQTVNLDQGEKLVCLFNVSCSHCKETAKDIFELKKSNPNLPDVYILFYGDEFFLDFFWDEVGGTFPYQFVDGEVFWPLLGDKDFPWVLHQKDGITQKDWDLSSYKKEGFVQYWNK